MDEHEALEARRTQVVRKRRKAAARPAARRGAIRRAAFAELTALELADSRLKKPSLPEHARTTTKHNDTNANRLTAAIVAFIRLSGGTATRVQTQGQYDPRTKRFRHGTTRKGTPDVIGALAGRYVGIEVKYGADRMSADQKAMREEITAAGGLHGIAKNFPCFWVWFKISTARHDHRLHELLAAADAGNEELAEAEYLKLREALPEVMSTIFKDQE